MGKTKTLMDYSEYTEEEINLQIMLKLNAEHQYYINLYENDIQEISIKKEDENKN